MALKKLICIENFEIETGIKNTFGHLCSSVMVEFEYLEVLNGVVDGKELHTVDGPWDAEDPKLFDGRSPSYTNSVINPFDGIPIMSKSELQKVALEHGGYATPHLNDTLYLHFKGYKCIENLLEYTGLKSLWLHSNGFSKLENVNTLQELRCLFLQRNCLSKIENLEGLNALVQLDLSENHISVVEGLSHLPNLTTLNLSKNYLNDLASISHLTECKELSSIDLSKNQLVGEDIINFCLASIVKMKSLNIESNPVAAKVAYFRKKVIVACKSLRYLDRPVFDDERATAEAFALGGIDAERQTKDSLQQAKRSKDRESLVEFRAWQESVRNRHVAEPVIVEEARVSPNDLIIPDDYSLDSVDEQYQSDPEDLQATLLVNNDVSEKLTLEQAQLEAAEATSPVFAEAALEIDNKSAAAETDGAEKSEVITIISAVPKIPHPAEVTSIDVTPLDIVPVVEFIPTVIQNDDEAKSLRDSIEQYRINSGTQHSEAIMAWSTDMEQTLMHYAKKYDYNFSHVSTAMAREHGIMFDSESCSRRWALLDLQEEFVFVDPDHPTIITPSRHEALFAPVVNNTQHEDFACPKTDKELAYFANRDGQRKTLDALMQNEVHPITSFNEALLETSDISDDGLVIVHPPSDTWLPSSMVSKAELPDMEDCDEDDEGIIHREELWRSMLDDSPRSVVFR